MTEPQAEALMHCIVDDCDWTLEIPALTTSEHTLSAMFGLNVMAAVESTQRAQAVEKELDRHLKAHTVLEWTRTLAGLREELAECRQEISGLINQLGSLQARAVPAAPGVSASDHGARPVQTRDQSATRRRAPEPETPRYTQDLPSGVVGRKT